MELLLVAMLMFIIIGMVSVTYFLAINTSRSNIDTTTSGRDARLAVYRITKDLRQASSLETAEYDNIIFYSNIDADDEPEKVKYNLVSEDVYYNLYREIDDGGAKLVVTHIIDNNLFIYYTDINVPKVDYTELGDIKIIEINIYIDQSGTETPRTMKLETVVALRNKI